MTDSFAIEGDAGTITVPGGTLTSVVTRAAEAVDGARIRRRGVNVVVAEGSARVRIDLSFRYGVVLPQAGAEVQRVVADALAQMFGLETTAVDLHVEELE
jgi:uncharacterized alkaline shock family protein YloU